VAVFWSWSFASTPLLVLVLFRCTFSFVVSVFFVAAGGSKIEEKLLFWFYFIFAFVLQLVCLSVLLPFGLIAILLLFFYLLSISGNH
jgi:hypothetical protein